MNPFLGQIMIFGGNFAPRGWAFCHGQLLSIAQNTALFSILGTTYGGDGRTTFGLPDFQGRAVVSPGHGPGLSSYRLGEKTGTETNVLTNANLPTHHHSVHVPISTATGDESEGFLAAANIYAEEATSNAFYPNVAVGSNGSNTPVNNMAPFTTINYIIALQGTFPSRS